MGPYVAVLFVGWLSALFLSFSSSTHCHSVWLSTLTRYGRKNHKTQSLTKVEWHWLMPESSTLSPYNITTSLHVARWRNAHDQSTQHCEQMTDSQDFDKLKFFSLLRNTCSKQREFRKTLKQYILPTLCPPRRPPSLRVCGVLPERRQVRTVFQLLYLDTARYSLLLWQEKALWKNERFVKLFSWRWRRSRLIAATMTAYINFNICMTMMYECDDQSRPVRTQYRL